MHAKVSPTSDGLLRCLQALAEETRSLGFTQTLVALHQAISLCRLEMGLPTARSELASFERLH